MNRLWTLILATIVSWMAMAAVKAADLSYDLEEKILLWASNLPQDVIAFEQDRYLSVLTRPISSKGRITLCNQSGLIWHQLHPIDFAMEIGTGCASYSYNATLNPVDDKLQAIAAPIITAVSDILFGRYANLQQDFELRLENGDIILTPKDGIIAQVFTQIILSGSERLENIRLEERTGDHTEIRLYKAQMKAS